MPPRRRVLDSALARYAAALAVDPLNPSLHWSYQVLHHRLHGGVPGEAAAPPGGA